MDPNLTINSSNGTLLPEERPFAFTSLFVSLFALLPGMILSFFILVAIATEKTMPSAIRFILANTLVACCLVAFSYFVLFTANVLVSTFVVIHPSKVACRFFSSVITIGGAARLLFMTTFATVLYIIVRHGKRKVKLLPTVVAVCFLWLFVILPNSILNHPEVLHVGFERHVACVVYSLGVFSYVYPIMYIAVYGTVTLTLSIIFPILSWLYIKRNTLSRDAALTMAMIKFTIFLCIVNMINLMGISVPILLSASFSIPDDEREFSKMARKYNAIASATLTLSLLPTPISILIFFQPIRRQFKRLVCFYCQKNIKSRKKSPRSRDISADLRNYHSPNLTVYYREVIETGV